MKQLFIKILAAISGLFFINMQVCAQDFEFHWEQMNNSSNRLKGKLTGTVYVLTANSNTNFFMHPNWLEGSITLEDNDVYTGLKLRLQAFNDELIVYNSNLRNLFVVDKEKVKSFTVNTPVKTQNFVKIYFTGYPKGDSYYEVLYDGRRKLLAYYAVVAEKTRPYADEFGIMKDKYYRLHTNYYMYSTETGFQKIKLRQRSLLRQFPDDKKEIRRLLRRNNIDVFIEKEMVRAFKLFDDLGYFN